MLGYEMRLTVRARSIQTGVQRLEVIEVDAVLLLDVVAGAACGYDLVCVACFRGSCIHISTRDPTSNVPERKGRYLPLTVGPGGATVGEVVDATVLVPDPDVTVPAGVLLCVELVPLTSGSLEDALTAGAFEDGMALMPPVPTGPTGGNKTVMLVLVTGYGPVGLVVGNIEIVGTGTTLLVVSAGGGAAAA